MSIFNGQPYAAKSVESILNQTFADFEFLIVDDASTDATPGMILEYARCDSRVKLVSNTSNIGLTRSLNRGLELACGQYIARQDADDVSMPTRLSKQVDFLDKHPSIGVLGSQAVVLNSDRQPSYSTIVPVQPEVVRWTLAFENCLAHSSVMFRRELLDEIEPYSPDFPYAQDYDLWWRASRITGVANLAEPLIHRYKGPGRISSRHVLRQEKLNNRVMLKAISSLLGHGVPMILIEWLRRTVRGESLQSSDEVLAVAQLIRSLYQAYSNNVPLTNSALMEIRSSAANRLYRLAGQNLRTSPRAALQVAWQAEQLDRRLPSIKTARQLLFRRNMA